MIAAQPADGGEFVGKPISFTIVNNAISTISFGYHGIGSCTVDGDTTITFNPPRPLNGNSFSLSGSGVRAYPFPPCTASGSASWNATR